MDRIAEWARELQSIAQAGLWYGKDDFDRERYRRVREIAAEMMAERTGLPLEKVKDLFCGDTGYQTPKIDTRAAIVADGKILLVRERSGLWSMPGGWCDYNLSPAENTIKEAREEAGLEIEILRLISAQDRAKHNRPLYAYNIVRLFYLCRAVGGQFEKNIETSESGWFAGDELPPLAEEKCTAAQVRMCLDAARAETWEALFD